MTRQYYKPGTQAGDLDQRIKTLNEEIEALKARMDDAETRLDALEAP